MRHNTPQPVRYALPAAAEVIASADALLITAGAGMGVDSGLPDFRGVTGFWKAFPVFARLGLRFAEIANPGWFQREPELAWGFYGHRLMLYRRTIPHTGFGILRKWATAKRHGAFVFTSNVDGQFQLAGTPDERIVECHGSIHHLQCTRPCSDAIWPAVDLQLTVDQATMRAAGPLPTCPQCGALARPNVLMFGDGTWTDVRFAEQWDKYHDWLARGVTERLAIVELGAGQAVPTVRREGERLSRQRGATLIRINARDADVEGGGIALLGRAADILADLDRLLSR